MIVAGFGFRGAATADSLQDALRVASCAHDVTALATLADKAHSPAFQSFAAQSGLPLHEIASETAETMHTPTQSAASQAARHTGSVAEACALAAAGPGAQLIQTRVISQDRLATCALAAAPSGETP